MVPDMRKRQQPPATDLHTDVEAALDILTNVCSKHHIYVAGFIYGFTKPLTLYNFGNSQQAEEIATYEKLVKLAANRRASGDVVTCKRRKPN